jgi:hypothetical protein
VGHKRSYAAYAREDVEDAKRGSPSISLAGWAAARGLEFLDRSLPGAFSSVMPLWPDYVANLSRGTLLAGRYGYLAHELDEVGLDGKADPRMPGPYHSLRVHGKGRGLLDHLVSIQKKRPNEPFAAESIWLPTTAVGVRIPEAVVLRPVTIRSSNRFPLGGNPSLDDAGLAGFRIAGDQRPDDERQAVGTAAQPLASVGAPYVTLRLDRGVLGLRRNGFVEDDAELDALVGVAGEIADRLADLARPQLTPQPFATPLPPPDPSTWPAGIAAPQPFETEVFARAAAELGMAEEDPIAFHRAHPACPVPGRALGLVRGNLPGTAVEGRVGFFDQGAHTGGTYRSAVMVPARSGATTPLGGTLHPASDLYLEVADGIAHAWPRNRSRGALNAAATVAAAVPTLREAGLLDG